MKKLAVLVAQLSNSVTYGDLNVEILGLSSDSRKIVPGSLFIALPGYRSNGREFVQDAIAQGAVAILTEEKLPVSISQIIVPDVRKGMEEITPYFYDYPGKKMRMIGLTGTNGKTTTTFLIHHLLESAGRNVGLIGTICSKIGGRTIPSANTTPDVVDLHLLLHEMQMHGVTEVVMEVSSHALALNRVVGCEFDISVFTNLTQDHLDFHYTLEEYRRAKELLFSDFSQGEKKNKKSIINRDDEASEYFIRSADSPVWTYGYQDGADFQVLEAHVSARGNKIKLKTPEGVKSLTSHLVGDFNVYNVLAAVSAVRAEGLTWAEIQKGLASFLGVPGRFEQVSVAKELPLVIVDYAHSPDGLKNVLETGRKLTQGRLISVFGCGGDRDKTKRPLMGEIGAELADVVIVTSDNPRSEDPVMIIEDILTAWEKRESLPEVFVDRQEAIQKAIQMASPEDVVIVAGKGHETYQILKDETIHFDDREIARQALEEKYGVL